MNIFRKLRVIAMGFLLTTLPVMLGCAKSAQLEDWLTI